MKLASAKGSGGRGLTRERHRRDRASTPSLRARFPDIATLKIEFGFRDRGAFSPAPQTAVLHPPAAAFFSYPCPYADCDGEFDLSTAVSGMVRAGDDCCEGQLKCNGRRRVDKGEVDCGLTLEYSIEARRT